MKQSLESRTGSKRERESGGKITLIVTIKGSALIKVTLKSKVTNLWLFAIVDLPCINLDHTSIYLKNMCGFELPIIILKIIYNVMILKLIAQLTLNIKSYPKNCLWIQLGNVSMFN